MGEMVQKIEIEKQNNEKTFYLKKVERLRQDSFFDNLKIFYKLFKI